MYIRTNKPHTSGNFKKTAKKLILVTNLTLSFSIDVQIRHKGISGVGYFLRGENRREVALEGL